MPDELGAHLTVKIGHPYTNSRTSYGGPIVFPFMPRDGYEVLRAKINNKLAALTDVTWESDAPILVKPCANTSQANFVALPKLQREFSDRIDRLCMQASRGRNGQVDLQFGFFIYVQRIKSGTGIHRATEARAQASAAAICEECVRVW
ncbi:hypothetical protein PHMEG_00015009 [Phytophthora megakarya]|uniref:Uncharacterized protein n=1 Tax=Phytophthora megakarya TaxID=4795 RepID=A0A225W3X5_9STRA|nr:hypothetical protein PHMEG_00015009 [Phytophthora megakarya]